MTKLKNVRSLDTIADSIHGLERGNIIDIGDLLLEAKAQCEHGQWLDWLSAEFEWWSADTAQRYMKVAELTSKYRNLRNLKLASTTLYELARQSDEDLSAIVKELAKHATKTSLKPRDAGRVIKIGIGRRRFGDHPDATLVQLVELDEFDDAPWHEKAAAALQEREPETDESASAIVDEIEGAARKAHHEALLRDLEGDDQVKDEKAEQEAESILDGASPDLPPPTTLPEPQRLGVDTDWAETRSFVHAVKELLELHAKPVARFVGMFSPAELREISDFLMAVAMAGDQGTDAALA